MDWPLTWPLRSAARADAGELGSGTGGVALRGISKRFGETPAVDNVSLDVQDGEFVSLLGPSGCGKTTSLRILAGFEHPDTGRVFFGGEDVTHLPAYRRGVGMVFQHYALFPHMTVVENIAFGLRRRHVPGDQIPQRIRWVFDLVRLRGYEARYPRQLSGGQQQRVALARAVVTHPRVLLLDEPLSNLDAKLREGMRVELRQIQREIGITTIFVTHDQGEALTLSDRVAVMNHGRIVQIGTPRDIYQRPQDVFVATFIGRSNILRGRIVRRDGDGAVLRTSSGLEVRGLLADELGPDADSVAVIRHELVKVGGDPPGDANQYEARLDLVSYQGSNIMFVCTLGAEHVTLSLPTEEPHAAMPAGAPLRVWWLREDCSLFSAEHADLEATT